MSMDKSDSSQPSDKGPSMKERLLAQRKAEADAAAAKAPADPKLAAAAARPAAASASKPAEKAAPAMSPRARVAAASAASGAPSAAERMAARRGNQHHTELSPDVKREVELLKQRENKTMTYVWITCGVLFLAAGAVLGNTLIKRANEERERKEWEQRLDDFKTKVTSLDAQKTTDAEQILKLGGEKESKELYKNSRIEGDIARSMSIAQRTIDNAAEKKDIAERLDALCRTADSAESQTIDTIKSARRTGSDLNDKSSIMDDDSKKRLTGAREKLDRAYLAILLRDAKAKGQTREALSAFTMAEIEIRTALDKNLGSKDEDRKKWYTDLYKTLLTDSDAIATAVFTPAVIDAEPWKDALADEKEWLHTQNLAGFALKDGLLHVVGPKPGNNIASISTADSRQLKDFVMQMEFTPVKGNTRLYFRVYNRLSSSDYFELNTAGKNADFKPGQVYKVEVRMIGSALSIKIPDTDLAGVDTVVSATKQRFGGIAFEVPEECEFKLTSFKYKELRSNKRQ